MKLRHGAGVAVLAVVIGVLGSCSFLGVTITDRIGTFATDLNTNRGGIYLNFDPATTQDYQAIQAATFWDTNFQAPTAGEQQYEVTLISYSDPTNVTGTIVGPPLFSPSGPRDIRFVMIQVNTDWFIQQLYLDNNPIATVKRPF